MQDENKTPDIDQTPQTPETEPQQAAPAPEAEAAQESKKSDKKDKKKDKKSEAQAELEQLRGELTEQKTAYLRLAAEYDNFRKRSQKEKDRIYAEAQADTTAKFLGILDNLERAVQQPTDDEAYKKGVVMIQTGYMEILGKLGVVQFGQEGETFDPNFHNAVMHEENPELGENTLSAVFQKGFRLGDKVIRPAMVKVAN